MTASQWFRDAWLIYEGATDKDALARSIVRDLVDDQADATALAGFLAHLQAELRGTVLEEEPPAAF